MKIRASVSPMGSNRVFVVVGLLASIGCSGTTTQHVPYASEDCVGRCETGVVAGGSGAGSHVNVASRWRTIDSGFDIGPFAVPDRSYDTNHDLPGVHVMPDGSN